MKILLATHQYFPEHIGGTEVYTHGIASRLLKKGDAVAVVTYIESTSGKRKDHIIIKSDYADVPIYQIHYNLANDPAPVKAEYNNPYIKELFQKILNEFQPDIVHFTHGMKISGSTIEACYEAGIPYLVTLTDFWFICPRHTLMKWNDKLCEGPEHATYCIKCLHKTHGFFPEKVMKMPEWQLRLLTNIGIRLFRKPTSALLAGASQLSHRNSFLKQQLLKAKYIICLSNFQKEIFIRNGYPGNKLLVLNHGLETGVYLKKEDGQGNLIKMITVSSVVHHKGVHIAVEAFKRSSNRNLRLQIYGNVSGKDSYHEMIRNAAKDDARIELHGLVPEKDLGRIFSQADVFLLPVIWYENEPLVLKAAIYAGLPIMASNIGSIPENIAEGNNGWLLPPGDIQAWTDAFDHLSRAKIQTLNISPGRVKTTDESFEEILSLYKKILL